MRNGTHPSARGHAEIFIALITGWLYLILAGAPSLAQTPEEHASHHAGTGGALSGGMGSPAGVGPATGVGPAGGMMEGMGDMMKNMGGVPPKKELYPSLMDVPEFKPEKRSDVAAQADERMKSGLAEMAAALDRLNQALSNDNFAEMQNATAEIRQGLMQFDSGVAGRRALAEGKPPRDVGLQWFRTEMSLPQPGAAAVTVQAPSWFHLSMMAVLILFAAVMVWMYFFKMRRAAALFGRFDSDSGPQSGGSPPTGRDPPPGGTPPLSGAPEPGSSPAAQADQSLPPGLPIATPPASPDGGNVAKIARRANELWLARGQPIGSPEIDWVKAEQEVSRNAIESPASTTTAGFQASALTKNWRGQLRVGHVIAETPNVKTFRLLPSGNGRFLPFTFVPGQFLNLAFDIGGARMNRSYSISSSPTQRDYVDLTVRREPRGAVSRHMVDLLRVGDRIEAIGPVGSFTFTGAEADSIVLISAGVGITPMMSITRYLTEHSWPGDIFFVYTCHAPSDFIFADQVVALQQRNPKLHVAVTISKAEGTSWKGHRGRITKEWLAQVVPDLASRRIHLCGPPSQMDAVKAMLIELGVAADHVKTEAFGATKPTPAAPGTTARSTAPATGPLVTFSKHNKSARSHVDLQKGDSPPKQTILELSEELGIGIEFSCRVGTCGLCKVKMTSGDVEMAVQDALDADDKANGIILACQAKPTGDVVVEA